MKKNTLLTVLFLFPLLSLAQTTIGEWTYYREGEGATITGSTATGAVTIPETIDGLPVKKVGHTYNLSFWPDPIFSIPNNINVTSVTIPNSVTDIGDLAFSGCESLTSITIPNSVTSIGESAFSGCSNLTSITIPNSVTDIGDRTFSWCRSLTSITIPNSVTDIGESAFSWCDSLTSITIPNSVTSIGYNAFSGCRSLTSITIPNSVTSIGGRAFSDCGSLTSVTIPNSVRVIGEWAFSFCGITSVTIPNSVWGIGDNAFSGCESLTSVTLPDSVTSIGKYAFLGCRSLTSVTIPNSVTSIGDGTFFGCSGLSSVTIPNSVTSIGDSAFSGCDKLNSVTVPASVTSIGKYAFNGCDDLENVVFFGDCPIIAKDAFLYCYSLQAFYYLAGTSGWPPFIEGIKTSLLVPPSIDSHPRNKIAYQGGIVVFRTTVVGDALRYQWYKNGSPIGGATASSYTITSTQDSDVGSYNVTVFNAAGSVTSNTAKLTIGPPPPSITSDLSTVSIPAGNLIPRFTITTNFGAKTFAARGLPKGLKLNKKNGVISGKPKKPGTYTVTLTARKMKGKKVEQQATATKVVIVY